MTVEQLQTDLDTVQKQLDDEQRLIQSRTEAARKLNLANYASIDKSRGLRLKIGELQASIKAEQDKVTAQAQ